MALLDDEDKTDIDEALEIYKKHKLNKIYIRKADEEVTQDLSLRWKRLEQELEIGRLKALEGLSAEVLMMAAKDPELQKQYYSLSLKKVLGQFTPDRIAALRLGENPELDNTLKDLILGLHDTGKLEQAEQLIKELKETRTEQREDSQRHLQTLMQMFTQALDAIARGA